MTDKPKKVDRFTTGQVVGITIIIWLVCIILAVQWKQAQEFTAIPIVLTACVVAARFRFWAAGVAGVLAVLLMLYSHDALAKLFSTYQATRDPLEVALEKTGDTLAAHGAARVSTIADSLGPNDIRLSQALKDSILDAANARREIDAFLQEVAETAGIATSKPAAAAARAQGAMEFDTSRSTLTYSVNDEQKFIVQVPPHHKIELTATTAGYICDPSIGLVPSIEGMSYYPDGLPFKGGFPARNARVFCLLAKLDDQQPQAFVDGACTLYNDTDDALDCYVLVNDRIDWSDNSGSIQITQTLNTL